MAKYHYIIEDQHDFFTPGLLTCSPLLAHFPLSQVSFRYRSQLRQTSLHPFPAGTPRTPLRNAANIAVSATQYQGLARQYRLAYSAATSSPHSFLRTPADSDRWRRHLERCIQPELSMSTKCPTTDSPHVVPTNRPVSRSNLLLRYRLRRS